jgi:hypothetical protein
MTHDDELRDPQLSSYFRGHVVERKAPKSWVEDALAIPEQMFLPEKPEPWLVTFAPHLGALFLIGSTVWALCHPVSREILSAYLPRFQGAYGPFLMLAGLLTPLLLVLCERGFRRFRA